METTETVKAVIEAQGVLQPGDEGFWPVWGATPQDIRAGDYVITAGGDEFYVQETYRSNAAPLRVGFVVDGEKESIGALCRIAILRPGTKNTLGDYVR